MTKLFMIVLASFGLFTSIAHGYSGTGSGGTCFSYSCKIVLDEPTKEEAFAVLFQKGAVTERLSAAIQEQRALQAQHIGSEAAARMTDEQVLEFIIRK